MVCFIVHGMYGMKVGLNLTKSTVDTERTRACAKEVSCIKEYDWYISKVASVHRIQFKTSKVQSALSPFETFWASIFFLT